MLVYIDTVIFVYAVDGNPPFKARATAHLASLRSAGDIPAISDLTWLECRVKPIRTGDAMSLTNMESSLTATDVIRVPMPLAVYDRACRIRAFHNFKLGDALHLAAAIEGGCGRFLTDDLRLSRFRDITVEILP